MRQVTLWEVTLPVSMARMLGDCPLVEHVEFRDCRVRIAVDYAMATPSGVESDKGPRLGRGAKGWHGMLLFLLSKMGPSQECGLRWSSSSRRALACPMRRTRTSF